MPSIETILSPALFHLYEEDLEHKNVVVIDILRATTTICVAFANGAREILPVAKPEEAAAMQQKGWIAAAERHGKTVKRFDLGNSPQDHTEERVLGQKIALTTTNGTRALQMSSAANHVWVGSFLNIKTLTEKLRTDNHDVLLFCAGWKDKFNLEDTVFAGAVASLLAGGFTITDDATLAAIDLYKKAESDLHAYLQKASHVNRFKSLHIESDLEACLKTNTLNVLPEFKNGTIQNSHNA
ncbi:MAG: 2-phosphosulfolactate phosphatase [Bacteroidetes bacterium]|nr:2-phosphosulfolactate phosphatase [Bacteroidota bacterium]